MIKEKHDCLPEERKAKGMGVSFLGKTNGTNKWLANSKEGFEIHDRKVELPTVSNTWGGS